MKKSELRQMIREELNKTSKKPLHEGVREDMEAQRAIFRDYETSRTRYRSPVKEADGATLTSVKDIDITFHYIDDFTGKVYKSESHEHEMNKDEFDKFVKELKKKGRKIKGANWNTGQVEYSI